jgi:alpha-D-xyloside xylohydrolase
MPIFVRAGSIVPMGPEIQYVDEKPADPIELRLYPGASGTFDLYEDDGISNAYLRGRHTTIPIRWDQGRSTLTLSRRQGSFPGMLRSRTFRVVVAGPGQAVGDKGPAVTYRGARVAVRAHS